MAETKPLIFQCEAFNKLRAKSIESPSFFDKFGYSNLFIQSDPKTNCVAKPNAHYEEEVDDGSTNAPESRTISLKSEFDCDLNKNKEEIVQKPKKKNIKLKKKIEKMLENPDEREFSRRFSHIEKRDEETDVWEF